MHSAWQMQPRSLYPGFLPGLFSLLSPLCSSIALCAGSPLLPGGVGGMAYEFVRARSAVGLKWMLLCFWILLLSHRSSLYFFFRDCRWNMNRIQMASVTVTLKMERTLSWVARDGSSGGEQLTTVWPQQLPDLPGPLWPPLPDALT